MDDDPSTLEVQTSESKDSMKTAPTANGSGARGPSSDFLKRRHERMRGRAKKEEEEQEEEVEHEEVTTADSTEESTKSTSPYAASSTALKGFQRFRAKARTKNRVPGGAAAKLIGKAPSDTDKEPTDDEESNMSADEPLEVPAPTDEFMRMREEAKEAFSLGTKENRRYHTATIIDESSTVFSTPPRPAHSAVLNRDEAYHNDATASVLSLLHRDDEPPKTIGSPRGVPPTSPTSPPAAATTTTTRGGSFDTPSVAGVDTKSTDFTKAPAMEVTQQRSALQAPPRLGMDDASTVLSVTSSIGGVGGGSRSIASAPVLANDQLEATTKGKNPLEQPLLSKTTEKRVAKMKSQMRDPDAKLSDLIANIATSGETSFSRGTMVRRKNACGALQVLTAKNTHRVQIAWTVGVLPAISSVLADSGNGPLQEVLPDLHTRREFIEARKRAVSSLMNLSMPPENRLALFHTPHLISNIVNVIRLDHEEARKGCCAVLAVLAKTKENRLLMVQVPGLIDAITSVLEPKVTSTPTTQYSEDEEDDDDDASYDSDHSSRTPDHRYPLRASSTNEDSVREGSPPRTIGSTFSEDSKGMASNSTYDSTHSNGIDNPQKASRRYDHDPNQHLHGARINVFALVTHLVKEKDNAYILARHAYLTETLVTISKLHDSPSHSHAVRILAHLTRHRGNSKHIVFKVKSIVPAMVQGSFSQDDEARKHACFALQNLAQDKPCRQELAITEGLLSAVCVRVRQASDVEERLSAIHCLKNLTDEPANLIPMTNTSECLATLMQIAHASDDSVTEMMQYLGCDALATLSHWFRSIATSGQRIEATKQGQKPTRDLFVPSLQIVTFEQWK